MKPMILTLCAMLILTGCATNQQNNNSLIQLDSGDTKTMMKIVEVERNKNTSKLKLTYKKRGTSVGSSMFIMRGFYEVAKARGTEYFVNLKEWDAPDGGRYYIGGFTNNKDADIHKEFGEEFTLSNEYGQKRMFMSVSQCNLLWGNKK
jgi:hypothetical protein